MKKKQQWPVAVAEEPMARATRTRADTKLARGRLAAFTIVITRLRRPLRLPPICSGCQ